VFKLAQKIGTNGNVRMPVLEPQERIGSGVSEYSRVISEITQPTGSASAPGCTLKAYQKCASSERLQA